MSIVNEGINIEANDLISFGNYEAIDKIKAKIEVSGDEYAVKTHKEITRLEKNGMLLLETVPGAAVFNFEMKEDRASFSAEGIGDTQITIGLIPETTYSLTVDDEKVGGLETQKSSGKVVFSVDLSGKRSIVLQKD